MESQRHVFADDDDNGPRGEHDFGPFELLRERIFWKIDYYVCPLAGSSKNPGDGEVSRSVLTITLASDH